MIAVIWTYDGWNNINFAAGEIKNPGRNLPFSLILGELCIAVLYVAINYVYLNALPMDQIAGVVGSPRKLPQSSSAELQSLNLGSCGYFHAGVSERLHPGRSQGLLLPWPKDKLFFKRVADVHPASGHPGFHLHPSCMGCLLTLSGTYETDLTYVVLRPLFFILEQQLQSSCSGKNIPICQGPTKLGAILHCQYNILSPSSFFS